MSIKDCDHEAWLDSGMCLICSPPDGWQYHAKCADAQPDLCFPDDNEATYLYEQARKMCEECPVTGFCLEIGLNERWGMWGGLDPKERYKLAKSGKVPSSKLERRKFLRMYAWTT